MFTDSILDGYNNINMDFIMSSADKFMTQASQLSLTKMHQGCGGPFGAIIVKDGKVISEGWNQVTSSGDPTAHAEVVAIRNACKTLNTFSLEGCILYTSCEPCPMCLSASYWARLERIYFANTRQDAANIGFDDDFIYKEIPLPNEKRSLPISQLKNDIAKEAFEQWMQKEDKIQY